MSSCDSKTRGWLARSFEHMIGMLLQVAHQFEGQFSSWRAYSDIKLSTISWIERSGSSKSRETSCWAKRWTGEGILSPKKSWSPSVLSNTFASGDFFFEWRFSTNLFNWNTVNLRYVNKMCAWSNMFSKSSARPKGNERHSNLGRPESAHLLPLSLRSRSYAEP